MIHSSLPSKCFSLRLYRTVYDSIWKFKHYLLVLVLLIHFVIQNKVDIICMLFAFVIVRLSLSFSIIIIIIIIITIITIKWQQLFFFSHTLRDCSHFKWGILGKESSLPVFTRIRTRKSCRYIYVYGKRIVSFLEISYKSCC